MKSDLERCVNLRMAGATYAAIAEQVELPIEEVERLVAEGVASLSSESPETRARLDLARLDTLLMGIWKQASRGDTAAVTQALKITGQRAALLAHLGGEPGGESVSVSDEIAQLRAIVDGEVPNV